MVEMENTGEGKDLAQMNIHRDGKKQIQFTKCFCMKGRVYQERTSWAEHAGTVSVLCKAEAGEGKMEDIGNMAGI